MSLRAFFRAIEAGARALPCADLAKQLAPTELNALRAARLMKDGPALRTWPCDQRSKRCGREVLESGGGAHAHAAGAPATRGGKRFVAVCEGSCEEEDRCVDVDLDASDLAQAKLDLRQLVSALRAAYRIEETGPLFAASAPPPPEPVRLGEERGGTRTRDVFLALRPNRALLAAFLEARERATRTTLVLVPTARALGAEVGTRNGPGAHVEVEVLEDAITVRAGKVTRVSRLRLLEAATPPEEPKPLRKPRVPVTGGLAAEIGATKWSEVKITAVDGHTLRIQCGKLTVRRTYIDLGFASASREPIEKWKLVMAICAGHGSFRWKQFGEFKTAKNAVSVVQRLLKKAFGLADNPIHRYRGGLAWQAKFYASSEIAEA